jgi:hypothetical protein
VYRLSAPCCRAISREDSDEAPDHSDGATRSAYPDVDLDQWRGDVLDLTKAKMQLKLWLMPVMTAEVAQAVWRT